MVTGHHPPGAAAGMVPKSAALALGAAELAELGVEVEELPAQRLALVSRERFSPFIQTDG